MSSLNLRQRAKVNAALVALHAAGKDASAVTASAKALAASGLHPAKAYERSLNAALRDDASLLALVGRALDQIAISDDGTVARYDHALTQFIQTGDAAVVDTVAPVAIQDAVTVAVRNGELSAEDVAAGRVDWNALGMSPESAQAAYDSQPAMTSPSATPATASTVREAPTPTADYIRTANGGVRAIPTGERAKREAGVPSAQAIVRTANGGYRGAMTGEKAARWHGLPMTLQVTPHPAAE